MPIWPAETAPAHLRDKPVSRCPATATLARTGGFESGGDHQQRRFARTRGAKQGNGFAFFDVKRHSVEDIDRTCGAGERQANVVEFDGREFRYASDCPGWQ